MAEVVTVKRPQKGNEIEPGEPEPVESVTGRAQDTPQRGEDKPAVPNSTMAERAKARQKPGSKQVDEAENKAITSAETKGAKR